jgi:L-histidine Nalpha-methyltransferase
MMPKGSQQPFNLNLLTHLNWRFEGDFDPDQFAHSAFYDEIDHQIEMRLRSLQPQAILLQRLDLQVKLAVGETIRTEISRKFHLPSLISTLDYHSLHPLQVWTDAQAWFGLLLCQRQCAKG